MPACRIKKRPPRAVVQHLAAVHECGVSIVASPIILTILGDLKWSSPSLTSRRSSLLSPVFYPDPSKTVELYRRPLPHRGRLDRAQRHLPFHTVKQVSIFTTSASLRQRLSWPS